MSEYIKHEKFSSQYLQEKGFFTCMIFFQGFSRALIKFFFFATQGRGQEKLKFWIKVYQGLTLINLEVQGKFEVNFSKVKVYPSRVNIQFLFKVFSRVTLEIPQNSRQLQGGHFREFCNLYPRTIQGINYFTQHAS